MATPDHRHAPESARIVGLDTIRFVAAALVAVSHLGPFRIGVLEDNFGVVGLLLSKAYGFSINGPAAVIVFFVVSGFCIHHPHRRDGIRSLGQYFIRRYVRIGIPLLAVVMVAPYSATYLPLRDSILWSVIAELIYYTLYPAILRLRARFSWQQLIVAAQLLAFAVVLTEPGAKNYPSFGDALNWALGLPCWLLGCLLAETLDQDRREVTPTTVWGLRLALWVSAFACLVLRFHSPVGYPWTLNLFAVIAFFWLRAEMLHCRRHPPSVWLERAGLASYSLYLVHLPAEQLPLLLGASAPVSRVAVYVAVVALTAAFYFLVEAPSHRLAKRLASLVRPAPRCTPETGSAGEEPARLSRRAGRG